MVAQACRRTLWNIHVRHVRHKKLVNWLIKLAYIWGVICRSRGVVKFLMKDYAGALGDLNKADALDPNNSFILQYVSPSNIKDSSFELDGSSSPRLRQKSMECDTLSLCAWFVVFAGCGEMWNAGWMTIKGPWKIWLEQTVLNPMIHLPWGMACIKYESRISPFLPSISILAYIRLL